MYCTPGHAAGAIVRVLRACRAERACAWDVVVHRPSAHARTGPSKPPSYCCCCCRRFDAAAAAAAEPEGLEVGGRHSQHSHGKRINYGRFACVHALGFKVYPSRVHQFQRYRTPRHSVNEILPPPTPSLPPPARPFFRNRFGVFSEIDRFWVVTVFNRPYILWRMDVRARWLSHVHGSISCSISFADFTCKFARWLRVWARRSAAQRVLNGQQQIGNITQMLALARMQMRVVFVLATKPSIYIHIYDDGCECVCVCFVRAIREGPHRYSADEWKYSFEHNCIEYQQSATVVGGDMWYVFCC